MSVSPSLAWLKLGYIPSPFIEEQPESAAIEGEMGGSAMANLGLLIQRSSSLERSFEISPSPTRLVRLAAIKSCTKLKRKDVKLCKVLIAIT